ncbi:MAG: pilus assembly protein N-terminal domain-containing protein [Methylocystis sp.]|nr:pilus assembly protein N-terminal domain-containing protein [Methylocystis sp.]
MLAEPRRRRRQERCKVSRMNFPSHPICRPLLIILAFASLFAAGANANERTIRVELDYARIVKIPAGAQTMVIGNPAVADVSMLRASQLMVITGRSFGTTNLIVLDKTGAQVGESLITVVPPQDKLVVQRGMHRESYSCAPNCAPSIDLADDGQYMSQTIEALKKHESAGSRH